MESLKMLDRRDFRLQTPISIPSGDCLTLMRYLIPVATSASQAMRLSFADHLRKVMGETSGRSFARGKRVDHSTFSRLLNYDRTPKLGTAARIIEGAHLSDAQAYQIVIDSVTVIIPDDACRVVFSDNAPALKGTIAEQLKGYRKARDLSQQMLAKRANIDYTSVWRLESEERFPSLPVFANLAFVLGLNARQVRGFLRTAAASGI